VHLDFIGLHGLKVRVVILDFIGQSLAAVSSKLPRYKFGLFLLVTILACAALPGTACVSKLISLKATWFFGNQRASTNRDYGL
jgi:hypothetical protein